ncbi:DUF1028 domain-containing protein [Bacillus lacus]|uniref:DUF1028 domain-containing protein n=1 Tax=Metabacillus lacus TaxID=1983721 RepID=A0A7X2LZT5_9BACI|nr:DUF1028 domain-containing protein [Metabacillus lacus]MRX72064.1 DUF1028 domain-containing protein [Metabacillus lacus]
MTYSIVGYDPKEREWGIAVQSKFLAVGAVVPFASAEIGAIATQSYANTSYGPSALQLMAEGRKAEDIILLLTKDDPDRELRQFGIVDAEGGSATYTGKECYNWAGGTAGRHFAAQGNILVSRETVDAMATSFLETEGTLAHRLLTALESGQAAGGDSRGQQSASLTVVKAGGGYGGFNDRYIDLRVDDHAEPISELKRLLSLHQLYFHETKEENIVKIQGEIESELVKQLLRLNYLKSANPDVSLLLETYKTYLHTENFEMREQKEGYLDLEVLSFMQQSR